MSGWVAIFLFSRLSSLVYRLRHQSHIYFRLIQSADYLRDRVVDRIFIRTDERSLAPWVILANQISERIDVNLLLSQEKVTVSRDGYHRQLVVRALLQLHLGDIHFQPIFHDVGCKHKDDEQDEDYVHQRNDVDFGHRRMAAAKAAAS